MKVYVIIWQDGSGFGIYGVYENKYLAEHIHELLAMEVTDKKVHIHEIDVITGKWSND